MASIKEANCSASLANGLLTLENGRMIDLGLIEDLLSSIAEAHVQNSKGGDHDLQLSSRKAREDVVLAASECTVWTGGYDIAHCNSEEDALTVARALRAQGISEEVLITAGPDFEYVVEHEAAAALASLKDVSSGISTAPEDKALSLNSVATFQAATEHERERYRALIDQRDALAVDLAGDLNDPVKQAACANWDMSAAGVELAALMQRFPNLHD